MDKSPDCIFCKIVEGSIPAPKVYEDERFICIRDIHPQAKVHLLVIPKKHIVSLETAYPEKGPDHHEVVSRLFEITVRIARQEKLLPYGFRTIINTGEGGGQTVAHFHLHMLGGEALSENLSGG